MSYEEEFKAKGVKEQMVKDDAMGQICRELSMIFCLVVAGLIVKSPFPFWVRANLFVELIILGILLLFLNNEILNRLEGRTTTKED